MSAYLTGTGAFLPGPPIDNAQIEDILGSRGGQTQPAQSPGS